jgi:DNA polymerase I-like protein with 3'-5' exonuclease and polymerase domains
MSIVVPETILVDVNNYEVFVPYLIEKLNSNEGKVAGLDCETQDSGRHQGLEDFMSKKKKLVFDVKRTIITGFSIYVEDSEQTYYFNCAHADVENRIPNVSAMLQSLIDANKGTWLAHNLPFELTMLGESLGTVLPLSATCTMQMAISAYGPDEYPKSSFYGAGLGGLYPVFQDINQEIQKWIPDEKDELPEEINALIGKICAKQSKSSTSYNGFVDALAWGYGLKKMVKQFFDYEMGTFKDTLGDKDHMGQLTGIEVARYGAEDAFWVVPLFYKLLDMMITSNPKVLSAFNETENPMCKIYSDVWRQGVRIDPEGVKAVAQVEKKRAANLVRDLQELLKEQLPFEDEPCVGLGDEKWYSSKWENYRKKVTDFCAADLTDNDDTTLGILSGPIATSFDVPPGNINLAHYMVTRTILYDLLNTKVVRSGGKVQSDADTRGRLERRFAKQEQEAKQKIVRCLSEISGIDQRLKLYLAPYIMLVDPKTSRLHPQLMSDKATRRMGMIDPNPTQLGKRGESVYIRSYYLPDDEEQVIVSADWSAFELVIIGELSGDPEFLKCYQNSPHLDLHAGAAADVLSVLVPGLTEDKFNLLRRATSWDQYREITNLDNIERLMKSVTQESIDIGKARGYWRTEIGKGANFNYWYSGWLATIGDRLRLTRDETAEVTERYRGRFPVAEEWRVDTQQQGSRDGWVELPDGHRRVRWEATSEWAYHFGNKLPKGDSRQTRVNTEITKRIQRRALNQFVNAKVQGTNAFVAKRSILTLTRNKDLPARFMFPVHDELVCSVPRSRVWEASQIIRSTMMDHPDVFSKCKLDATVSFGLNYEPFSMKKQKLGQVEMHEAPEAPFVSPENIGKYMTQAEVENGVEWLFEQRKRG